VGGERSKGPKTSTKSCSVITEVPQYCLDDGKRAISGTHEDFIHVHRMCTFTIFMLFYSICISTREYVGWQQLFTHSKTSLQFFFSLLTLLLLPVYTLTIVANSSHYVTSLISVM